MNKLKILLQTPLTERDYKRFGVELLGSRGIEVSFADMTPLLNPEYIKNHKVKRSQYEMVDLIKSEMDFELLVKKCDKDDVLFIDLIGARNNSYFIYHILENYRIKYASFCANAIPALPENISIRSLLRRIKSKVINLQPKMYAPSYVLAGGDKYLNKRPSPDKHTKFIWAHTLDYDLYLDHRSEDDRSEVEGKYAVFLDEYFPLHPDHLVSGARKNPYHDPDEYFTEMNKIFGQFEKKTGIPVVITAHPRSNYEEMPGIFNGRKIMKNNTINLVSHADCALAHGSTSINYAVLFKKPIVFLMPEKVKGGYYGSYISNYAKQFGKSPFDLDSITELDINKERNIDNKMYVRFKEKYIKKASSPNKYFWEIVAEAVN
ncbi:MAG: hypothetical protein U9R38_03655 [Candidatus Margulisiibacteriota bacterium]|nr:hypothetical protein [Candidatus Margulisiibacteriota bacterium]